MMTKLDALLAQLKQEHGDEWFKEFVAMLTRGADRYYTSDSEYVTYAQLHDAIVAMVAAGVAATEQPAAWEPVKYDAIAVTDYTVDEKPSRIIVEEYIYLDVEINGQWMNLRLLGDYRLCRLVQRPANVASPATPGANIIE